MIFLKIIYLVLMLLLDKDKLDLKEKLVKQNGGNINQLRFVPAMVKNGHFAVILDSSDGEVIDTLVIDPCIN